MERLPYFHKIIKCQYLCFGIHIIFNAMRENKYKYETNETIIDKQSENLINRLIKVFII